MADVTMPQLGETVTEGTITQWFKNVGDAVKPAGEFKGELRNAVAFAA